jgi:hypothetical protein
VYKPLMEGKLRARAHVALKSDPNCLGVVLEVNRSGRTARVQFQNYPRPTMHAVEGLVLVQPTAQKELFSVAV